MNASANPDGRSAREIWDIARSQLRLQLPQSTYDTWVRDTACIAHEDGAFVIAANNAYAREWLQLRLRRLIKQTLVSIVGHTVDVNFIVQTTTMPDGPDSSPAPLLQNDGAADEDAGPALAPAGSSRPSGSTGSDRPVSDAAGLTARYTFDTFIVGASNRMAHASAMAVAERPGTAYNPLFIYGGSGLGKTHLLQAIGRAVQARGQRVLVPAVRGFHQRPDQCNPDRLDRRLPRQVPQHRRSCCSTTCTSLRGKSRRRRSSSIPSTRSTRRTARSC